MSLKDFISKIYGNTNAAKLLIYLLIAILLALLSYISFICYDVSFSKAARLSKKFNQKIELFIQQHRKSFKLEELTDFEWTKVCFYNEEGKSINLKDYHLVESIGYKPEFFLRSTYFVDYDHSGLLFSDTKSHKVYVLHYLRAWYHLTNIKPLYNGCYDIKDNLSFVINY